MLRNQYSLGISPRECSAIKRAISLPRIILRTLPHSSFSWHIEILSFQHLRVTMIARIQFKLESTRKNSSVSDFGSHSLTVTDEAMDSPHLGLGVNHGTSESKGGNEGSVDIA